ncbi:MAG: NFACT family protein [Firmicutes bacterium]|nr:NFACT family protein [Bacillota bacterium]
MAYDGFLAGTIARQLDKELQGAKIERVQQPEADTILLQIYAPATGARRRLLFCTSPQGARVHYTKLNYENPAEAPNFCMLLRKHLQGGRILSVSQPATERILKFHLETINEMGYSVNKMLICEIMGKHSNLILTDEASGKIIDAIKRISIDVNRYRQILPGMQYVSPPPQDKTDLWTARREDVTDIREIQGLSASAADEFEENLPLLFQTRDDVLAGKLFPAVYCDPNGYPRDVHIFPMKKLAEVCEVKPFDEPGDALDFFYGNRKETNRVMQRSESFAKSVASIEDKLLLKKQRLLEDVRKAENADIYRLKGELLNANLHLAKTGDKAVTVISYYDGQPVTIELDERFSPARNAQNFFKKYAKAKTGKKEKLIQLEECEKDIEYLSTVRDQISLASTYEEMELIREELIREGYLRGRVAKDRKKAAAKAKPRPRRFTLPCGREIAVGRNNSENDYITFKVGGKTDYWLHTKDIHGSHVVLFMNGEQPGEDEIYQAAAAAAWFSKGKDSQNVPVDYVPLRYVKKPAGAKPGMVIFTNNRTVWVDPKDPDEK